MAVFAELLSESRRSLALTAAQLAKAVGVSEHTIASWEIGRRTPGPARRQTVIELADRFKWAPDQLNDVLDELGLAPVPSTRSRPLLDRRKPLAVLQSEIATYAWPTLAMNEDFEVIAWNDAANDLSELDFAKDLAEPGARHLLRMALSKHYREKLVNFTEVITVMMSLWKSAGFDPMNPAGATPYFQNLFGYILANHMERLAELLQLWEHAPVHLEGDQVVFPAEWRTSTGVTLRFNCQLTSWSEFDGVSAFDWHPADAPTWEWLEARRGTRARGPVAEAAPIPATAARDMLRAARERQGLTRRQLARRANVSEELIYGLEAGRRRILEPTLLTLVHAMALNAAERNTILDAAGFTPEPSDLPAYILGYDVSNNVRYAAGGPERRTWTARDVREQIAGYAWPTLVVDDRCEVIASNSAGDRLFDTEFGRLPAGPEQNLFTLVTDARFRARVTNWDGVVAQVLPANLEVYLSPPGPSRPSGKERAYFDRVVAHVREREAAAGRGDAVIHRMFAAWRQRPGSRLTARVTFDLHCRADGKALTFDAVITPWNTMLDPYWDIQLHPGDGATSRWLNG